MCVYNIERLIKKGQRYKKIPDDILTVKLFLICLIINWSVAKISSLKMIFIADYRYQLIMTMMFP